MSMNLSEKTIGILKNFGEINPKIAIDAGSKIQTISLGKNIVSHVTIEEKFPKDFAIYDLPEFLNAISLFDNPSFKFADEFVTVVGSNGASIRYFYGDRSNIFIPQKQIEMPEAKISFNLSGSQWIELRKASNLLRVSDLSFISEDGKTLLAIAHNKSHIDSTHNYTIKLGKSSKKCALHVKFDSMKILPHDFKVSIAPNEKVMCLKSSLKESDLTYYVAMEPDSIWVN